MDNPKTRIVYLDIIRIVACAMIFLMHSARPDSGMSSIESSSISMFTASGIGLFLMVSGALLLPVRSSGSHFWRHRLGKVVVPTLFWTLFYMFDNYLHGETDANGMIQSLLSIPFSAQGRGFLWFMYMMCGLYMLAPIISPWLAQCPRRELETVLALWGVTLCFPFLKIFLFVNESPYGMYYYFSGFAGYFILGHYFHRFSPSTPLWVLCLCLVLPLVVAGCCYFFSLAINFYDLFWYLSILIVLMASAWYLFIQKRFAHIQIPDRLLNYMTVLSNCSFGMFLMHIFLMRRLIWSLPYFNQSGGGLVQTLLIFITTFALSFVITYMLSFLPFSKWIIAYTHAKKK